MNGAVYFIEATGMDRVKIGSAKDPRKRLKELQTGSPARLRILATIEADDARRLESRLHTLFRDARVVGEWFHATRTLQRIIEAAQSIPTQVEYADSGPHPRMLMPYVTPSDDDPGLFVVRCCDLMEVVGIEVERDDGGFHRA